MYFCEGVPLDNLSLLKGYDFIMCITYQFVYNCWRFSTSVHTYIPKLKRMPRWRRQGNPRLQTPSSGAAHPTASRKQKIMGNACCGGEDDVPALNGGQTVSGAPPAAKTMTPTDAERREKMLNAAEERYRQGAVRGTQRKT